MAFLPYDLYLASGTATLINNWTDPVYKFDSSSFYNWEQDNLPIYDLEDRDDYLYEMAGYPASSVDGFMLTVSDCGIDNKKVFPTISAAIGALPKKIRFPVIIEVCTSGQLGGLHLESKDFEGSTAGIEIINRGFAKVLAGSSVAPSSYVFGTTTPASSITKIKSWQLSSTMLSSQSLGVSETVWVKNGAATNQEKSISWWNNFTRSFFQTPEWSRAAADTNRTVSISNHFGDANTAWFSKTDTSSFDVSTYQDNSVSSDMVITNGGTGSVIQRAPMSTAGNKARATGFTYANALSGASIKDCTGKVYIRGFCVDGATGWEVTSTGTQRTDVGFEIENSEVVVENCTATRCKNAGMEALNSNVTLNRGFIAFHNYELSSGGGGYLNVKVDRNPTPGLRAINSNITLSAATVEDKSLPIDSPFSFYRNIVGVELQNSELVTPANSRGGTGEATNAAGELADNTFGAQTIVGQSFYNVREGIKADNSLIETGYRLASFQNKIGLKLNNSTCRLANVSVDFNLEGGVVANNSLFNYNKNGTGTGWTTAAFSPPTRFVGNGQHIVLNSSQFIPTYVASGMAGLYKQFDLSGNHQVINYGTKKNTLPAVVVDKGSYMQAVGSKSILSTGLLGADSTSYKADQAIKGSAFRVTNQSTLDLFGTSAYINTIVGPYDSTKQQKTAGLYSGNNSHIYVAGPTTIVQLGVDALAEDNSKIEFGPHHKDGIIDPSGWGLQDPNCHTKVQLHATRACLVANKNSIVDMHDMGDYHARWASKYLSNVDYPTGNESTSGYQTSAYYSSGTMVFYPNPYFPYPAGTGLKNTQSIYPTAESKVVAGTPTWTAIATNQTQVSGASVGGMCVRAVGDSQVNVKNVNFGAGWFNPSGPYYDVSSTQCEFLRIWNIADNSELHASYLSVDGLHPQDMSAAYHGPYAMWASAAPGGAYSGAPSSTPDTSTLSVLDYFGSGWNAGIDYPGAGTYGKSGFQNIGPFRLYVSPHPKAKFLGFPFTDTGQAFIPYIGNFPTGTCSSMGFHFGTQTTTMKFGAPYQIIAQGYNPSSDCSATNNQGPNYNNVSAIYQDLGFSGYVTTLPAKNQQQNVASSFYYTSGMLPYDSQSRIWLDESAMNTWANAKNGTLNTSGRKKICSFYESTTAYPGEAFYEANKGYGLGFGSANLFDLDREL